MKTNSFNYYSYDELRAKALSADAEQIDIDTLGEWFEEYGRDSWNGEYYDADGYMVFPVYSEPDEFDDVTIIGYELR